MTTVTQWFSSHIKPAHIGVYEKNWPTGTKRTYQLWDGSYWHKAEGSADAAAANPHPSDFQFDPWRGLAEQPK